MPLPKPNKGESQGDFIGRCMSNNITKKDFPDNTQRTAMCFSQWKKSRGEKMEDIKRDEQGRIIVAENVKVVFNSIVGFEKEDSEDGSTD